jgi:hypothetical protein
MPVLGSSQGLTLGPGTEAGSLDGRDKPGLDGVGTRARPRGDANQGYSTGSSGQAMRSVRGPKSTNLTELFHVKLFCPAVA